MDKVLDKLGIYDLFVNLIAGIAMLSIFGFLSSNLYGWCIVDLLCELDVWFVLVLAYFTGIIFQELSNFFETMLYRLERKCSKNRCLRFTVVLWFIPSLDRVLMKSCELKNHCGKNFLSFAMLKKKRKRDLDDTEIDAIMELASSGLSRKVDSSNVDNIYHYCKSIVAKNGSSGRLANDQSHASMARSLSLFSVIVFLITLIQDALGKIAGNNNLLSITLIASAILTVLFLRRNKRFSEMRYVNTFRMCIYNDKKPHRHKFRNNRNIRGGK